MAAFLRMRLGGAWRMGYCTAAHVLAVWRAAVDRTPAPWSSSSDRGLKACTTPTGVSHAPGSESAATPSQEVHYALTNYELQIVHQPQRPAAIGYSVIIHSTAVVGSR